MYVYIYIYIYSSLSSSSKDVSEERAAIQQQPRKLK